MGLSLKEKFRQFRVSALTVFQNISGAFFSRFPIAKRVIRQLGVGVDRETRPGWVVIRGQEFRTESAALQDVFVQIVSEFHLHRDYLEIGSGHPKNGSNSFVLESLGWRGLSIEINEVLVDMFKQVRGNQVACVDALAFEYERELPKLGFPNKFGYLQIDVEPAEQSLRCLEVIPFDSMEFACITFEHDSYAEGRSVRDRSRELLQGKGYVLVVSDVQAGVARPFEDWWINPKLVDEFLVRRKLNRTQRQFKQNW